MRRPKIQITKKSSQELSEKLANLEETFTALKGQYTAHRDFMKCLSHETRLHTNIQLGSLDLMNDLPEKEHFSTILGNLKELASNTQYAQNDILDKMKEQSDLEEKSKPNPKRETDTQQALEIQISIIMNRIQNIGEQLSDLKKDRNIFVATIRHNIGIFKESLTELNKKITHPSDDLKELLENLDVATIAQQTILDDCEKITTGNSPVPLSPVKTSPAQLTRKLVNQFSTLAQKKEVNLTYEPTVKDDVELEIDPTRYGQIIANLTSNALKFTPEKGNVTVRIQVESLGPTHPLQETHQALCFSIQDTGIGMTSEEIQKLLSSKEFAQANNQIKQTFGGSGFGLRMCRNILQQMGAEDLEIQSQREIGTTFSGKIPCRKPFSKVPIAQDPEKLKTATILVAEDNISNQKLLMRQLEKLRYAAYCVSNGKEAVTAYKQNFNDSRSLTCIIMDMQMPVMSGIDATREIRQFELQEQEHSSHIPILALTGNGLAEDKKACLDAGMDDVLIKPLSIEDLGNKLSTLMIPTSSQIKSPTTYSSSDEKSETDSQHSPIKELPTRSQSTRPSFRHLSGYRAISLFPLGDSSPPSGTSLSEASSSYVVAPILQKPSIFESINKTAFTSPAAQVPAENSSSPLKMDKI